MLPDRQGVAIRCFLPHSREVSIVATADGTIYPAQQLHPQGFYEAVVTDKTDCFTYQIRRTDEYGQTAQFTDPYSFLPGLGEMDLYFLREGSHHKSFEKLGSHMAVRDGVAGVQFAVWAPNARCVSVIGGFNNWDSRFHMLRMLGDSGIWEIFIPGIGEGASYKYQLRTLHNEILDKTDPYGFYSEISPRTASIVYDINKYQWHDQGWLKVRATKQRSDAPISIYEVHLGSWVRDPAKPEAFVSYRELAHRLVNYVQEMGYTHIELLPVLEHPFYGSWGYQVVGYYAPTSRHGKPDDFMYFVDYCHQHGIGVILDWVAAHFPKDGHGLAYFDGTHLYEHDDPRMRDHKDWNTFVYNYGRYEVKNFLASNALFWLDKYHLDGLRMDAVASMLYLDYSRQPGEWVPNKHGGRENLDAVEFLQELNDLIRDQYPGVMAIAEESTSWPKVTGPTYLGGLGFTAKWNMGWMNDMLRYMALDPILRKYHHQTLAFSVWYSWSEHFILPLSHDEVVHGKASMIGKMAGDATDKLANLRLLYGYMFAHPGKKLLFMGNDFGQWREWNHDQGLDWHLLQYKDHRELHRYVRDLNHFYRNHSACYELDASSAGFEWADFRDADYSVIAFWRKAEREELLFVFNFTPVARDYYRIGVEHVGRYREIFNSDADIYGGTNTGNLGEAWASAEPWHDHPCCLTITLPPLAMLVFAPEVPKPHPKSVATNQAKAVTSEAPKAIVATAVATPQPNQEGAPKSAETPTGEAAKDEASPKVAETPKNEAPKGEVAKSAETPTGEASTTLTGPGAAATSKIKQTAKLPQTQKPGSGKSKEKKKDERG